MLPILLRIFRKRDPGVEIVGRPDDTAALERPIEPSFVRCRLGWRSFPQGFKKRSRRTSWKINQNAAARDKLYKGSLCFLGERKITSFGHGKQNHVVAQKAFD